MKRNISVFVLLILLISTFLAQTVFAWDDCGKGLTCEAPGKCGRYVDTDGNNICDHGEPAPAGISKEEKNSADAKIIDGENSKSNIEKRKGPDDQSAFAPSDKSSNNRDTKKEKGVLASILQPELIVLLAFLIIASILYSKPYFQKLRYPMLAISILYLGFYIGGCLCAIGALTYLPTLISGGGNSARIIQWLLMSIVPIVFMLFAGRIFCGSVCPMGAVQEFLFTAGKKLGLNKGRAGLEKFQGLKYIKYVLLAAFVTAIAISGTNYFCRIDPFRALFNFKGKMLPVIILVVLVVLSVFFSRLWCRFICPYGAFMGIVAKLFNKKAPRIDSAKCTHCKMCEKDCPVNAINDDKIDYSECISCGKCQSNCKLDAIK